MNKKTWYLHADEGAGLFKYVPAMCRLDYTMAEVSCACDFVRKFTLAGGGPCCGCGYKKKGWFGRK